MKRLTLKMFDKRKFVLESQVKEEGNLYHLKEMWQRLSCCAKTLGLKKKKGRECEGERHISPFLSKAAHQLQSAKNKGRTKLS